MVSRCCLWLVHYFLWLAPCAVAWQHVSASELAAVVEHHGLALAALVHPLEPRSRWLEAQWDAVVSATADEALASIDCSADGASQVCALAPAYPAILLFRRGSPPTAYQGFMTASAISKYLDRCRRPDVTELTTAEALSSFQSIDQVTFVAFFTAATGQQHVDPGDQRISSYRSAALQHRGEFSFGLVTDSALAVAQAQDGDVASGRAFVVCHRPADGHVSRFVFPDPGDAVDAASAALRAFVHDAGRPDIADLTPANHQRYLERGWPMVYLFACSEPDRDSLRASLAKLAKSYRDSLTIVVADPADFPGLQAQLGLAPGQQQLASDPVSCSPSGALHQLSKDRVYPYPSGRPIDARSIQQWGLDVFQGRIKPWTPPGSTTSFDDLGPTRVATRRVSIASIPGLKIRIAGHDHNEL